MRETSRLECYEDLLWKKVVRTTARLMQRFSFPDFWASVSEAGLAIFWFAQPVSPLVQPARLLLDSDVASNDFLPRKRWSLPRGELIAASMQIVLSPERARPQRRNDLHLRMLELQSNGAIRPRWDFLNLFFLRVSTV
jgi:hypothetical protein